MEQDSAPRHRRQAAIAADKQRAEQKPAPRAANGAAKEKKRIEEEAEEEAIARRRQEDKEELEVAMLEVRAPADRRMYTSIAVKATERSKPVHIDNISPFVFIQKADSTGTPAHQVWPDAGGSQNLQQVLGPVKKKVKMLPRGLIKEMSGIVEPSPTLKIGRKRRAATLPAPVPRNPINSITGGPRHDFTAADSNDAFRHQFYAPGSYVEGEAFVNISRARSLGQNYGNPSLQLRRAAAAAERERQAREETISADEEALNVADDQETLSGSSLSPDIEASERRMALTRAQAEFDELQGQYQAFQEKAADERREMQEVADPHAELV
ncbi:hypothetical protein HII31_07649 [Pseudocercospora fuligena]|uniref:Uncharacterized protein n=1 Tax=Pseudocercospora fuligena TaxID=685502 RepID=A0A8H6RFQ8_9PEZI|nr:hypothetical protein HII31_07649 [Pseudocercospora fuligena]